MLVGDVAGAIERYRRASRLNELDMGAMYGTIECELLSGKVRGLRFRILAVAELAHCCTLCSNVRAPELGAGAMVASFRQHDDSPLGGPTMVHASAADSEVT